jgi:uncharacterized protein (TIGR03435 family)
MRNGQPKISLAMALLAAGLAAGQAFAPKGSLKFEAATIKPSLPGTQGGGVRPAPGGRRFVGSGVTLRVYLFVAYQVKPEQIEGGPPWADTELYDLSAEAEKPSSIEGLHVMLQNFLVERFKLQFHFEKKEMQAYMLTVDKGGPKNLKARLSVPGADFALDRAAEQPFHEKFNAHCVSLNFFTWALSSLLDHPIINQTNLDGCFDFEFTFTSELPPGIKEGQIFNGVPVDTYGPTVFQALQRQLGLKMEAKKAPVETMVIDHAERPAEE